MLASFWFLLFFPAEAALRNKQNSGFPENSIFLREERTQCQPESIHSINIAKEMGVSPSEARKYRFSTQQRGCKDPRASWTGLLDRTSWIWFMDALCRVLAIPQILLSSTATGCWAQFAIRIVIYLWKVSCKHKCPIAHVAVHT